MNAVIIVAGGKGTRFGGDVPKQFLQIIDRPIYIYTIQQFKTFDTTIEVILVVPETSSIANLESYRYEIDNHQLSDVIIIKGGKTRFHSVKNGLSKLSNSVEVVGIHDAVRPLVSQEVIKNCYSTANTFGSAIPTVKLKDSIRELDGEQSKALNRNQYRLIQTPQCFTAKGIMTSYEVEYNENFTDDASVFEAAGYKIKMVEGNFENIKITSPPDLYYVQFYLSNRER